MRTSSSSTTPDEADEFDVQGERGARLTLDGACVQEPSRELAVAVSEVLLEGCAVDLDPGIPMDVLELPGAGHHAEPHLVVDLYLRPTQPR